MEIFDNVSKIVKDDLEASIEKGSRLAVAAACFSIYAYQALKKQLDGIDKLRFIFTSPAFVTEKAPKEKREFYIPTPVGDYSPDWAISFKKGAVKHIFFIAETKGTMNSLELRPIEKAKIDCAKKLFNEISTAGVKYHNADSYQSLLDVMRTL